MTHSRLESAKENNRMKEVHIEKSFLSDGTKVLGNIHIFA